MPQKQLRDAITTYLKANDTTDLFTLYDDLAADADAFMAAIRRLKQDGIIFQPKQFHVEYIPDAGEEV